MLGAKWLLMTEIHPERSADVVAVRIDSSAHVVNVAVTPLFTLAGRRRER